jgi:hypothetical protein
MSLFKNNIFHFIKWYITKKAAFGQPFLVIIGKQNTFLGS